MNTQSQITLNRTERDATGRSVNIYRKTTQCLTKEQSQVARQIKESQRQYQKEHEFSKFEGKSYIPKLSELVPVQ